MEHNKEAIDLDKIRAIIDHRLVRSPKEVKITFPDILKRENIWWLTIDESSYLLVAFTFPDEDNRINKFIKDGLNPFPGLITIEEKKAAFRIDKSRFISLRSSTVTNSYSLSLGHDSSIFLEDHTQIINTVDLGKIEYKIPLAYLLSYGEEINKVTVYEYLDGLVAHSTKVWRESYVR